MFKPLTNKEFFKKLKDNNVEDIPLEDYKGTHTKIKWMCKNNNKHIFDACPCDMYDGKCHCPYCNRRKVFVGETDMWTTNPELAAMLNNPEDGYKYFATGGQSVDWNCPCCGLLVKDKVINNVNLNGLSCENCSDGISFGEKFIHQFLIQSGCDFVHDRTMSWSNGKRYDFYIPSMNLIIEVHGIQHYKRSFQCYYNSNRKTRSVEDEIDNDVFKKELALSNGVKYYVELDCRNSDGDYIKTSIVNSKLSNLFNLFSIDWDKCYEATLTSNVVLCAELWNDGMKNTMEIANYTGIHYSSVISNLKKANKAGLCDYIKHYKKNKNRYKMVMCIETKKIYESIASVKKDGYTPSSVSNCCNNKQKTANGLHWRFI